jgi:hypothetical protein
MPNLDRRVDEVIGLGGLLEVGKHQDVEQLGAGSWPEAVEALPELALELIGPHRGSLRRREGCPRRRICGRVTGVTRPCAVFSEAGSRPM